MLFWWLSQTCREMPGRVVLSTLEDLRERGDCDLTGVGETAVGHASCTDELGTDRCTSMTTSGMFDCNADFCSSCALSGHCDQTCSFCEGASDGSGHRRVQLDAQCDPEYFMEASANVTGDCCDGPSGCDSTGVPTTCDAKCATRFVRFFDRCSHVMMAFDPSTMPAFHQLCVVFVIALHSHLAGNVYGICYDCAFVLRRYDACTSLPLELILASAAQCSEYIERHNDEPLTFEAADNGEQCGHLSHMHLSHK